MTQPPKLSWVLFKTGSHSRLYMGRLLEGALTPVSRSQRHNTELYLSGRNSIVLGVREVHRSTTFRPGIAPSFFLANTPHDWGKSHFLLPDVQLRVELDQQHFIAGMDDETVSAALATLKRTPTNEFRNAAR